MPSEVLSDELETLRIWASRLPPVVTGPLEGRATTTTFGERHGTWALRVSWLDGPVFKIAEIALSNPEPTPDEVTSTALVSVRAGATTNERFTIDWLERSRRRTVRRLPEGFFEERFLAAVRRAIAMDEGSLKTAYETGLTPPTQSE